MERVQRVIATIEPHDSVERYTALGVECVQGTAKITSPVDGRGRRGRRQTQTLTTRSIVIAAGARPFVPPIPGHRARSATSPRDTRVGPARAAAAPGGAGRRADRLRAGAGVRAARLAGDAGRDAAAHHDARGPGGLGAGARSASSAKASTCCVGHKAKQFAIEGRREGRCRRARRRARCASRSTQLLCAVGRVAQHRGLRARRARHRRHAAHDRRDQRVPADDLSRTSTPAATSPGRSSSRTPRRTRRGTRRSTRCSAASRSSRPTTR